MYAQHMTCHVLSVHGAEPFVLLDAAESYAHNQADLEMWFILSSTERAQDSFSSTSNKNTAEITRIYRIAPR